MRNWIVWITLLLAVPVVAAEGIAGKWHFVTDTDDGQHEVNAIFELSGEQVTGTWQSAKVQGTFADGKLKLAFPLESPEAGPGTVTSRQPSRETCCKANGASRPTAGRSRRPGEIGMPTIWIHLPEPRFGAHRQVDPDQRPSWGALSAQQMIVHLAAPPMRPRCRNATGAQAIAVAVWPSPVARTASGSRM